jgi:hypothetical protein
MLSYFLSNVFDNVFIFDNIASTFIRLVSLLSIGFDSFLNLRFNLEK